MTNSIWGLLAPESLPNTRRTRTLGIASSVRFFNDRAVPGLGGVWFAKPVLLSLLGIRVAELASQNNIGVANALEALGCWLTIHRQKIVSDPRVRGARKLRSDAELRFKVFKSPSFYVSQPMRMATNQILPALGLVEAHGSRFNGFRCSPVGQQLLDASFAQFARSNREFLEQLQRWVQTEDVLTNVNTMSKALSLATPISSEGRLFFIERIRRGGDLEAKDDRDRRRNALDWVEAIRHGRSRQNDWNSKPPEIQSDEHWHDLYAGACFFKLRNSALAVLDIIEAQFGSSHRLELNASVLARCKDELAMLQSAALDYAQLDHRDALARAFCKDCTHADPETTIRALVNRDGIVLKLLGQDIGCGPAFAGVITTRSVEEGDMEIFDETATSGWPPDISFRVNNLNSLNLDLHGELDSVLLKQATTESDT